MGTTTGGMSEAQDKALQLEVDKKLQDEVRDKGRVHIHIHLKHNFSYFMHFIA